MWFCGGPDPSDGADKREIHVGQGLDYGVEKRRERVVLWRTRSEPWCRQGRGTRRPRPGLWSRERKRPCDWLLMMFWLGGFWFLIKVQVNDVKFAFTTRGVGVRFLDNEEVHVIERSCVSLLGFYECDTILL